MKKYNGTTWVDTTLRQYKTATDTFTTLPAAIYADGNNATVGISGNTTQSGTPTPDNPIMPEGTGERTGNLFDITVATSRKYVRDTDGTLRNSDDSYASDYIDVSNTTTLYPQYFTDASPVKQWAAFYDSSKTFVSGFSGYNRAITVPNDAAYVRLTVDNNYVNNLTVSSSELESYEPYGIEIPILNNSQTTNVYLGEVQSTRRVKKQVVTISRIIESGTPNMKIAVVALDTSLVSPRTALSTVVPYGNASTPETFYYVNANNIGMVGAVGDTDEQITAKYEGSILYYGIAETTGIVNEPLMKIGNYADTVSGITIPTITSKDTFDVDTTLKPSEVELTYTGWHDASVKEWDGSDWQ